MDSRGTFASWGSPEMESKELPVTGKSRTPVALLNREGLTTIEVHETTEAQSDSKEGSNVHKKAHSFEIEQLDLDALYLYGESGKPEDHEEGECSTPKGSNSFKIDQMQRDELSLHGEAGKSNDSTDKGDTHASMTFNPDDFEPLDLDALYMYGETGKPQRTTDRPAPQHEGGRSQVEDEVYKICMDAIDEAQ